MGSGEDAAAIKGEGECRRMREVFWKRCNDVFCLEIFFALIQIAFSDSSSTTTILGRGQSLTRLLVGLVFQDLDLEPTEWSPKRNNILQSQNEDY